MQTLPSKEAKYEAGKLYDLARLSPVIVGFRANRPWDGYPSEAYKERVGACIALSTEKMMRPLDALFDSDPSGQTGSLATAER